MAESDPKVDKKGDYQGFNSIDLLIMINIYKLKWYWWENFKPRQDKILDVLVEYFEDNACNCDHVMKWFHNLYSWIKV